MTKSFVFFSCWCLVVHSLVVVSVVAGQIQYLGIMKQLLSYLDSPEAMQGGELI